MADKIDNESLPDMEELRHIARQEAWKALTKSGGHEIDDVVQSSIADYLVAAGKDEIRSPGAFVRTIANRRAMKYRDKWEKKRSYLQIDHLGRADDDGRGNAVDLPSAVTSPSAEHAKQTRRELVAAAVYQLAPVDQEIARLTYQTDPPLTAPEVAMLVGLTPGTVRNHLVAIRRTLAGLIDDEVD